MNSQHLAKSKLPHASGVYFFLARNKKILYIGRATSLRDRVRSYFGADLIETRGPQIIEMVAKASRVDFKKTDSVLEAILLEADLIKKFQPQYNTREKDDKSFNCVVITKEDFPQVLIMRKRDLDSGKLETLNLKLGTYFGPFTQGAHLKEALKIVRKIFPYRDNKCNPPSTPHDLVYASVLQNTSIDKGQLGKKFLKKPCFNRQIGLCPGVCTGEISKVEYARTIVNIKLFFTGKKSKILKNLQSEMKSEAKAKNFERAHEIKKTLFALQHIQDIALLGSNDADYRRTNADERGISFRIEAYDIAHISGTDVVGAMVVVEDGLAQKANYKKFKIRGDFGNNDTASLKEVINRRLKHPEWPMPALFVADGGLAQKAVLEASIKANGLTIPVVAVTKNERHRPEKILGDEALIGKYKKSILLANSEAHRFAISFHRERRGKSFI